MPQAAGIERQHRPAVTDVAAPIEVALQPTRDGAVVVVAAIILAMVTMFLRGIRFQFQYLHETARKAGGQP